MREGCSLGSTGRTSRTAARRTAAAVPVKRSPRAESDADRKSRYVQSHLRAWCMHCVYVSMRYGKLCHPVAARAVALISCAPQNTRGARFCGRAMRQRSERISLVRDGRDAAGEQRATQATSTYAGHEHALDQTLA